MTKRYFLIGLGWVSVILGVIGIFLPILPTTPFILLAAWAFAQSSQRFYHWLVTHRQLGPIVRDWQSERGISRRVRNRVIGLLWLSLTSSSLIMAWMGYWWTAPILAVAGAGVTAYLLRQRVLDDKDRTP